MSAGQPFLQVEPAPGGMNDALEHALPVQALNSGAELLERALGRPLFPLKCGPMQPCLQGTAFGSSTHWQTTLTSP